MALCSTCAQRSPAPALVRLDGADYVVALAGNPNTGKSCVFNRLTGLRQHVGNWPGKTVQRAEGWLVRDGVRLKLVDLPGTYSLLSTSTDEEVARDFLLFGRPDVVVIVVDATALERNLNLVYQVLEISDRVVIALNLVDEARRKGLRVDAARLAEELGVPVVPTVANAGVGLPELAAAVAEVATGARRPAPRRVAQQGAVFAAAADLVPLVEAAVPGITQARWVALRLLENDPRITEALATGELEALVAALAGGGSDVSHTDVHAHAHDEAALRRVVHGPEAEPWRPTHPEAAEALLTAAAAHRARLGGAVVDELVGAIYAQAEAVAGRCVTHVGRPRRLLDDAVDRVVTSRAGGLAVMLALLAVVFWLTIAGANVPSDLLARGLFGLETVLAGWCDALGSPWWLTGALVHGMYRGLAWVVSVMLPPMAIFFPLFTLLEDLGYLPRVAFNLDRFFRAVGAHGKQALTMSMGFGCNAAGVVSCRIIDSPRERLIAILTNNFVPCNGRWPTLILLSLVFVAPLAGPSWGTAAAAATLVATVVLGVAVTLVVSAFLSRTWLRGEASAFTLEMPSYRRPQVLQVLYTSLIDRTLKVLWRAVVFAAPAGLVIWILGNWQVAGDSAYAWLSSRLDPLGRAIGLDGVILLAYVVAIPANEIIVPTIFMGYNVLSTEAALAGQRVMVELDDLGQITRLLTVEHHWTLLTAVCLVLFCLLHNPCSTTIYTIYKETHSRRWTAVAALLPLAIGFVVCFVVAQTARWLGWA